MFLSASSFGKSPRPLTPGFLYVALSVQEPAWSTHSEFVDRQSYTEKQDLRGEGMYLVLGEKIIKMPIFY